YLYVKNLYKFLASQFLPTWEELEGNLNSSLLRRAATIVRKRCNVFNGYDFDARLRQGTDSALTTRTRTFNEKIYSFQTSVQGNFRCIGSSHLGGITRVLFRTAEAHFTGAAPGNSLARFVGQGHDNVVESCRNMRITVGVYL